MFVALGLRHSFCQHTFGAFFWLKRFNKKVGDRNAQRQKRSPILADAAVQGKVNYARQIAAGNGISESDLVYTTETDLLEQENKAIKILRAV